MFTMRVKALHFPTTSIYLMQCHHVARPWRDVMSFCNITFRDTQCNRRCHVSCPNWPPRVDNSLKCLLPLYSPSSEANEQAVRQSNAEQNNLLNTLPLVIVLLFQKQVLDKTAQAQPTVRSGSQITNLFVLILITFYLQVHNQAFIQLTALSSNKLFIWRVFTVGFPL